MRLLLDTRALLWWAEDDPALSGVAREAIADADVVHVSAASAYEVLSKFRGGKLPTAEALAPDFAGRIKAQGLTPLPITLQHAARAGGLPMHHRDPFDRLLMAQALEDSLTLVSNKRLFDSFGVSHLW